MWRPMGCRASLKNAAVGACPLTVAELLFAQGPTFDVASVKPAAPDQRRYVANNVPLGLIMTVAYSVTDLQLIHARSANPKSADDKGGIKLTEHDLAYLDHPLTADRPTGMESPNVTMSYFTYDLKLEFADALAEGLAIFSAEKPSDN